MFKNKISLWSVNVQAVYLFYAPTIYGCIKFLVLKGVLGGKGLWSSASQHVLFNIIKWEPDDM